MMKFNNIEKEMEQLSKAFHYGFDEPNYSMEVGISPTTEPCYEIENHIFNIDEINPYE